MNEFQCEATPRKKRAGASKPFTIDLRQYLRAYWMPGQPYSAGDAVRAPSFSGFAYQAGADGETGSTEPSWPRFLGGTCVDGSIPWTAIDAGANGVDAISGAPVWSQVLPPDNALTIGTGSNTLEETTNRFSGGTAGSTYRIMCTITTVAGNVYIVEFDLEVG